MSGVAHDFNTHYLQAVHHVIVLEMPVERLDIPNNNILTIILSYSHLIKSGLTQDCPTHLREEVDAIIDAGKRGAVLTSQLLNFARRDAVNVRPLRIDLGLAHPKNMLRRLIREDIVLHIDPPQPDLYHVLADENQLEQVVVNLTANARDAMPNGGHVWISLSNCLVDETLSEKIGISAGEYAKLQIKDTGVGMPPEVMTRVFDPFFTTKGVGKGTGLGLSTVLGIVKQGGGTVTVDSEVGVGSVFTVYFPRWSGDAHD